MRDLQRQGYHRLSVTGMVGMNDTATGGIFCASSVFSSAQAASTTLSTKLSKFDATRSLSSRYTQAGYLSDPIGRQRRIISLREPA